MTDPLRRLKYIPWRSLFQVSVFTILIVVVLELFIGLGYEQSPIIRSILLIFYTPPLSFFIPIAAAIGVGTLSVYLLERLYPQVSVNSGSLWALVLCVAVVLSLKSLLPVQSFLVSLSYLNLVGIVVGTFWKGRPYWR